ncbi:MAG: 50S ribosomal protein L25 [Anaerovoracaceae bacterium]|jgi:large subunit ribosomal protein L25
MSNTGTLIVETRTDTSSQANRRLRKAGYVPGNIFGKDMESIAVKIRKDELRKNIAEHGRAAVFKLVLDGSKNYNVMIKDIQLTHVNREFMHVDFHKISLSEETKANVPVKILGDELYEQRRLLLQLQRDMIPVKGLPQDIPNFIEIDVKDLDAGDTIFVKDIKFPGGITPDLEETQLVVSISEAKIHQKAADEEAEGEAAAVQEES